jgi:hypothetical protein
MKRISRDAWLTITILLLLLVITGIATVAEARRQADMPPLATFSDQPDGARALRLWADSLGYDTDTVSDQIFTVPAAADLLFILEPALPGLSAAEWETVDDWVNRGGTLLLAGAGVGAALAMEHYSFTLEYTLSEAQVVRQAVPLLLAPPVETLANARAGAFLRSERVDFATVLTMDDEPVLVVFPNGNGRVILTTLAYPLSNAGLKEDGNPQLVLNLFSFATNGRKIWFDEWHHGVRRTDDEAVAGPLQWLRHTPAGNAIIYSFAVVFGALLLAGRRLGAPVSLNDEKRRRPPTEHVDAIANLTRRAGHRQAILGHYRIGLKRRLGQRYRIPVSLDDEAFVAELLRYQPELDASGLQHLLSRLGTTEVSEDEMLQLAREVAAWLNDTG